MCEWLDKVEEKNKMEIAKRLIARGKDTFEEIAEITELSLEKVQELAGVRPA